MELVIHIGRLKTGTTAIQRHLSSTQYPGLAYPTTGRVRPDGALASAHHELARMAKQRSHAAELHALAEKMARETHDAETVVISSESFDGVRDGSMEWVIAFIDALRPDAVTVICYVREQLDYIASLFQQVVKNRSAEHDFLGFVGQHREMDLGALLARWSQVGDVRLRLYDPVALHSSDAVTDFLRAIGREPAETPSSPSTVNPSIAGTLLAVKAVLNRFSLPLSKPKEVRNLARTEPRFRGRFRVPSSVSERIRAASSFNTELLGHFPDLRFRDLSRERPVPDDETFDVDLPLIAEHLQLSDATVRTVRESLPDVRRWFLSDLD